MDSVKSVLATPAVDEFVFVNHVNPPATVVELRDLAAENPKFKLIETGANLGFGKGCNLGAEVATGELLLFLNPDAVLVPTAADQLMQSASQMKGEAWIIGGRILNDDGSEQRGARRGELTLRSAAVSFLGLERLMPWLGSIHWEDEQLPEALVEVPTVSGAAMLIPREVFARHGGFDERYFLHVEDIDLCRTMRNAGGRVFFEPRANILHYGGTSETSPLFVETHKAAGLVKYFWKFYPSVFERTGTVVMAVPVFLAIWARVAWHLVKNRVNRVLKREEVREPGKSRLPATRGTSASPPQQDVKRSEA